MGVPAGLARHSVAPHRLVTNNDVFEDAGQDVVDAGARVGVGWAFVEGELEIGRPLLDALVEHVLILPELEDALLHLREACLAIDSLEHGFYLFAASETARP